MRQKVFGLSNVFMSRRNIRVDDIKDMMADLPAFQKQRDQFSLHLGLAEQCMEIYSARKLVDASRVEQVSGDEQSGAAIDSQDCATGYNSEGKVPRGIVQDLVPLLDERVMPSVDLGVLASVADAAGRQTKSA